MSSPTRPSPIPASERPVVHKKGNVLQSSLDLVFSCASHSLRPRRSVFLGRAHGLARLTSDSRSQQLLYGKNLRSSPSFLEGSPHSPSRHPHFNHDIESGHVTEEDEAEDEEDRPEDEDRRSSDLYGAEDLSLQVDPASVEARRPSVASERLVFQSGSLGSRSLPTPSIPPSELPTPRIGLLSLNAPDQGASRPFPSRQSSRMASTSSSSTAKAYGAAPTKKRFEGWSSDYAADEDTPLLSSTPVDSPLSSFGPDARRRDSAKAGGELRRKSSGKLRRQYPRGESTDGQTLFNAVAVLLGIGLLSLPLAFAYAGWIGGTAMLVGFAWATCHTAKLLARIIHADGSLMGYTDIGRAAFGPRGSVLIIVLFCLELFALGVALIVLFGDTFEMISPMFTSNTYKLLGLIIMLPSTLIPLRLLSLPSLLSSLSTLLLVVIILLDGFMKTSAPGSILHPSETSWSPEWKDANWLGGIGLVLAGFGGHAVVPSLARDMKHPENFDKIITQAFSIAAGISFFAAAAGYLMIGNTVSDEITRDLMLPKYGYSRALNIFALWMIVVIPLTKFGLCSRPLNVAIETLLGITKPVTHSNANVSSMLGVGNSSDATDASASSQRRRSSVFKGESAINESATSRFLLRAVNRTVTTGLCCMTAILLPGFGKVMAFLGSFSAFLICIILPLSFYMTLQPRMLPGLSSKSERMGHLLLLGGSIVFMIAGTVWAFLPDSGHGDLEE